ncbi:hypothetical protein [Aristophania vespae]|uniref:hypothetical protein n=1 Tax=Aristophania vespae TaxID=2697033 RepID=UPI0023516F3C|nr:hypothetical protein [Aristophania vespae]UMM63467.1 hypothetical protein DM15PD_04340 [Aristophania vespae]
MNNYALLTHDFKIVKADSNGQLCAVTLSSLSSLDNIVYVSQRGADWSLLVTSPLKLWFDNQTRRVNRAFAAGAIAIEVEAQPSFCRLKLCEGGCLTVESSGEIIYQNKNDSYCDEKDVFRFLSPTDLKILWHVAKHRWALDPDAIAIELNEFKSSFKEIHFGPLTLSLEVFLNFIKRSSYEKEIVFLAHNNIYRAVLLKPAILLAAFGEKVVNQLSVALESIADPGDFEGNIFIVTNVAHKGIERVVPHKLRPMCQFLHMEAYEYTDYIAIRQTIISSGILDQYSPILYMDIDVVINVPLEGLLCRGALEKYFSAQIEYWHPDFREAVSTGQLLYSQDPYPVEKREGGFNSGIFFLPNFSQNKAYFDRAFYTHMSYTTYYGRGVIPFPEQHVLNYALRKMQASDLALVTELTEVGGFNGMEVVQHYGAMNVTLARGFVHFWCTSSSDRGWLMADYLARIRKYRASLSYKEN